MKAKCKGLVHRIGHRGSFLLFLAVLDFLYGYSMIVSPIHKLPALLPLHIWGIIWICVGFIMIPGAFAKRDRVPYGVAATIKAAWAGQWVLIWLYDSKVVSNAWANVALWAAFSGIIVIVSTWPEVRPMWGRRSGGKIPERKE